jgi:hypothetical protein
VLEKDSGQRLPFLVNFGQHHPAPHRLHVTRASPVLGKKSELMIFVTRLLFKVTINIVTKKGGVIYHEPGTDQLQAAAKPAQPGSLACTALLQRQRTADGRQTSGGGRGHTLQNNTKFR